MRNRTRSPLGFSRNPKRSEGVGLVVGLGVEIAEPDGGGSWSREVVNVCHDEGGGRER